MATKNVNTRLKYIPHLCKLETPNERFGYIPTDQKSSAHAENSTRKKEFSIK